MFIEGNSAAGEIKVRDTDKEILSQPTSGESTAKVAAGDYQVIFESNDYLPAKQFTSVKDGEEIRVVFQLQRRKATIQNDRIVTEPIYFETAKAIIKEDSKTIVDEVAELLHANPNMIVKIEGHTDDMGEAPYNLDLSDRRTKAVKEYLVQKGIATERLETMGFGEQQPIADNKTNAGRAKNRRVEFKILNQ
jgi:outer membrane protein OmpA-like peptidoglycan-associated protein